MNYRFIFNTIGKVLKMEGVLLLFPLITAFCYVNVDGFDPVIAFAITMGISLVLGYILTLAFKPKNQYAFAKEGLITVALAWISMSLIGALPFVISKEIPNYIDALFETISGFTTTGASILTDVELLSHGAAFWRSFTHWIGGMGVLVFVLAFARKNQDRSIHILRAEMAGPVVDKLVPRARDTAIILYVIYIALTFILFVLLLFGGMDAYESLVHAFGTAGTGGFGIKPDSLASYNNYCQWVIAIFMLIFGVNFNLYFFIIIGKISGVFKNTEFWVYIGMFLVAVAILCVDIYVQIGNFADTLRISFFQASSVMTTTGYATYDFDRWGITSKTVLYILMFIGGCAGSTAGGFKVSRVLILFKTVINNLKRVLHPRTTTVVKVQDKKLDEETIKGVTSYLTIYVFIFFILFLLLSFDPNVSSMVNSVGGNANVFETNMSAVTSCLNNIGPAFSGVGPMMSYTYYNYFSKIILSFAMLLGRLEIYPILLTFSVFSWTKK
jgi:trk system potassium uptake protein TrkH